MSVVLHTKQVFNIEHINTIFINTSTGLQKYFIYSILVTPDYPTYFIVLEDTKYIGYYDDTENMFIIINIKDEDEDFKEITTEIQKIERIFKRFSTKQSSNINGIFEIINNTENFEFFEDFPHSVRFIQLDAAKEQIAILNSKFKCLNYRISIDYIFQLKENTVIQISDDQNYQQLANTLLLSIFKGDTCISSIEVILNNDKIGIFSNTHKEYQKRKFNKLLRSVIIIIATSLYPTIKYVYSVAVNPISSYLMVKHFNAKAYITEPFKGRKEITTSLTKYADHKEYFEKYKSIITYVEINAENIDNANRMFDIIDKEIKCKRKTIRNVFYASGDENDNGKSLSSSSRKSKKRTLKSKAGNIFYYSIPNSSKIRLMMTHMFKVYDEYAKRLYDIFEETDIKLFDRKTFKDKIRLYEDNNYYQLCGDTISGGYIGYSSQKNICIFTYENDNITGICIIDIDYDIPNAIEVKLLCVPKIYKGKGRIILNKLIEIANSNNIVINLEAVGTVSYYKRFGFQLKNCTHYDSKGNCISGYMTKIPDTKT